MKKVKGKVKTKKQREEEITLLCKLILKGGLKRDTPWVTEM